MAYDFTKPFSKQVAAIAKMPMTVLWTKCKSSDFIRSTVPFPIIASQKMPVVFSCSISYHLDIVNMLKANRVITLGYGYVHDSLPDD